MEQSEFLKILREKEIEHEIKGDITFVLGDMFGNVYLNCCILSLPENVHFNNGGGIDLNSLESLPENIQFNNGGSINLVSLKSCPESTQFNNGEDVFLNSIESLPENTQFNNGGYVFPNNKKLGLEKSYIERHNIKVKDNKVILYKKVSKDFLTQEGMSWETLWRIGSTLIHPKWDPKKSECGEGKFHACAVPFWCDIFRGMEGDRYIAIEVKVKDLYEWEIEKSSYPQKIAFRKCKVLYECDRFGTKV